jgi:VanZ family protein
MNAIIRLITFFKPYAKYMMVAWLLAIISVSSVRDVPTLKIHTSDSEFRLDYLIHFCEYGILAFLTFLTYAETDYKRNNRKFAIATALLILFAILDEYHQKFIPGRAFNVKDIMSNIAGILAALIFCITIFRMISLKIRDNT